MLKKFASLCLIAILVMGTACTSTPQTNSEVDKIFAAWDHDNTPGCAVGVIQNGQWAYQHAYGMADLEAKTPITTENTFYIGSMAKQFTAMSILLLAEQGKLSLLDDIHKYLPELPDYGTPITIQNLIHHTSGIREYMDLWEQKAINEWDGNPLEHAAEINAANTLTLLASQKTLNFSPGEQYAYSNTNYFLLGVIVQRVSGMSLRQFADESIFKPLGMTYTQYRDDVNITIPNLAVGYVINPDGSREPQQLRYQLYTLVGEGGLYSTLNDLLKWDQNFYHNQLGKQDPHLIDQMLATHALNNGEPVNYAFGLVVTEYRGITEIEHGGGWFGYRSDMARFPEKQLTVIELCNFTTDADSEVQDLTSRVADLFLGD